MKRKLGLAATVGALAALTIALAACGGSSNADPKGSSARGGQDPQEAARG